MKDLSILLGLSGSAQARQAAELSWDLAKRTEGTVTAQHVIDNKTAWSMLRFSEPGFIGSGVYIAAYESLHQSLTALATKLIFKYESMADGAGVKGTTVIDEGNPVTEICKRALDHDLVVVGHRTVTDKADRFPRSPFMRYAIAEALAYECPRPLVVCQGEWTPWKAMKILTAVDHMNMNYINSCIQLASMLKLEPHLVCLATGQHEEDVKEFAPDLRLSNAHLKEMPIDVQVIRGTFVEGHTQLWNHEPIEFSLEAYAGDLLVVPTREVSGTRITLLGTLPELFIERLALPTIMLWPEEFALPTVDANKPMSELAKLK